MPHPPPAKKGMACDVHAMFVESNRHGAARRGLTHMDPGYWPTLGFLGTESALFSAGQANDQMRDHWD